MKDLLLLNPWLALCLLDIIERNDVAPNSDADLLHAAFIARAIERGSIAIDGILRDPPVLSFLALFIKNSKSNFGGAFLALFEDKIKQTDAGTWSDVL